MRLVIREVFSAGLGSPALRQAWMPAATTAPRPARRVEGKATAATEGVIGKERDYVRSTSRSVDKQRGVEKFVRAGLRLANSG